MNLLFVSEKHNREYWTQEADKAIFLARHYLQHDQPALAEKAREDFLDAMKARREERYLIPSRLDRANAIREHKKQCAETAPFFGKENKRG
jgi:hypothetical protein